MKPDSVVYGLCMHGVHLPKLYVYGFHVACYLHNLIPIAARHQRNHR